MRKWSDWINIELAKSRRGQFNDFGIYQIRAVTRRGKPLPIRRLVGVDTFGILYIGRSGYRRQQTQRTVANRIREFLQQQHSGGITYAKATKTMAKDAKFAGHLLQARALFLPDNEIKSAESKALRKYFVSHGELPPCNSQSSHAR